MIFDLVDVFWHDDLSLFPEDGQDAVKEIVWGQTDGHGDFSCFWWLRVVVGYEIVVVKCISLSNIYRVEERNLILGGGNLAEKENVIDKSYSILWLADNQCQ